MSEINLYWLVSGSGGYFITVSTDHYGHILDCSRSLTVISDRQCLKIILLMINPCFNVYDCGISYGQAYLQSVDHIVQNCCFVFYTCYKLIKILLLVQYQRKLKWHNYNGYAINSCKQIVQFFLLVLLVTKYVTSKFYRQKFSTLKIFWFMMGPKHIHKPWFMASSTRPFHQSIIEISNGT